MEAACLLRSPDHGFNLLILFCQLPTETGKFLCHSVQLVTKIVFSFRRLTMTLAFAQGQNLASCLLKTYWNSKLFLRVFVPCLFPPGVVWFSTIELKSFTNNPTDFRGFCWKITITINRKYSAPGDELATCLHSIGWCCLSPASASDTPVRVRQWQTPWQNALVPW